MLTTLITLSLVAKINTPIANIDTANLQHETYKSGLEIVSINPIPEKKHVVKVPLSAHSAYVIDLSTGKVLFEKNKEMKLPIASITKVMTAIVALDLTRNLDDVVHVPKEAARVEGSSALLKTNERVKVKDLIKSMLIASGNDAAVALAIELGGSEKKFVELMNEKAEFLGMQNTHFTNEHGLDAKNNYSTVEDLSKLAKFALKKKFIKDIIAEKQDSFISEDGITHTLISTNKLLGMDPEIIGFKTGSTALAGECFMGLAKDSFGNEILTVILKSDDRFGETQELKQKIWDSYVW